jgi:chemotaxis signal transduction protein
VKESPARLALLELRRGFDRSFAERPAPDGAPSLDLLEIRVHGVAYALRTSEIAGVIADRPVAPLPTTVSALRGLINVRGAMVPVYDLSAVLGHGDAETPRWLAIVAGRSVALAFEGFEGHTRVDARSIVPRGELQPEVRFVDDVVQLPDRAQPILSLTAVVDTIRRAATMQEGARRR